RENRISTITPVVDVVLQGLFPFPSPAHFNFTSSIPAIDFFFGKKLQLFYFHSQRIHRSATAKRSSADVGGSSVGSCQRIVNTSVAQRGRWTPLIGIITSACNQLNCIVAAEANTWSRRKRKCIVVPDLDLDAIKKIIRQQTTILHIDLKGLY